MKREVAAKAGNFRGVCPLNGRKNPLTACGVGFVCTEFVGQNPDRKVRFCKKTPETHETVFKGNAPLKNVCHAERYLLYTHVRDRSRMRELSTRLEESPVRRGKPPARSGKPLVRLGKPLTELGKPPARRGNRSRGGKTACEAGKTANGRSRCRSEAVKTVRTVREASDRSRCERK